MVTEALKALTSAGIDHVTPDDITAREPRRVQRIDRCELVVGGGRWAFAEAHAAEIDAHWQRRLSASPGMFNGVIHILGEGAIADGGLSGRMLRTDFKSFLFWKDHGYPDRSVRDAFGSALLLSAEGHVMLGRQAAGHLNSGLSYLPGGFIDARDADVAGRIDVAASVAREIAEETGLDVAQLTRDPGFITTEAGALLSIAVAYRSPLSSKDLQAAIHAFIAAEVEPELSEVVVVRCAADLEGLAMPHYAEVLLPRLLAGDIVAPRE
jgi:8-oxo-dGTP pyrophosphatase MutT (NUDIX family)